MTLIGIVEDPRTGKQQAFHDVEKLWSILAESNAACAETRRTADDDTKV